MAWIKQHLLMFLIAVGALALAVWYGLSSSAAPAPLLTTDAPIGGTLAETTAEQEIVGTLLALRAVTLNGTIFSDPAFTTLQDFGTMIVPEPAGRANPFVPASRANASASSTTIFTPRR